MILALKCRYCNTEIDDQESEENEGICQICRIELQEEGLWTQ